MIGPPSAASNAPSNLRLPALRSGPSPPSDRPLLNYRALRRKYHQNSNHAASPLLLDLPFQIGLAGNVL